MAITRAAKGARPGTDTLPPANAKTTRDQLLRALDKIVGISIDLRDKSIAGILAREPQDQTPSFRATFQVIGTTDSHVVELVAGTPSSADGSDGPVGQQLSLVTTINAPVASQAGSPAVTLVVDLNRGEASLSMVRSRDTLRAAPISALALWGQSHTRT